MNDQIGDGPEYYYHTGPVGVGVMSLVGGFLTLGLTALVLQILTSLGYVHVLHEEARADVVGAVVAVIIIFMAAVLGLTALAAERGGKNLRTFWRLSSMGVPAVVLLALFVGVFVARAGWKGDPHYYGNDIVVSTR